MILVLGLAAQDYVLRHLHDAPGSLGALVARALQAVLSYVPAACLVAVDSVEINGHMVGLFVHRRQFPGPYNVAPWGTTGALATPMPAAVYMDATYLTVHSVCTEVGASIAARLWDTLPDPTPSIENVVNVGGIPWRVPSHPSREFVAARIFTDVRSFAPSARDAPVPIWVPCDRRRQGTFGVRLHDLCELGEQVALLQPCPVETARFAPMLRQLAWRHPPVGIEMRAPPDARCEMLVANGTAGNDLVLPVLVRDESYDPAHERSVLARLARTCKRDYTVYRTRATLNDVCGVVDVLTIVV